MQKSQLIRVLSDSNKCPTPFCLSRQLSQETPNQTNYQSLNSEREVVRLTKLVSSLKKENDCLTQKIKLFEQSELKITNLEQKVKSQEQQIKIQEHQLDQFKKLPIDKIQQLIEDNDSLTQTVLNQSTKIKQLLTQIDQLKDNSFQNEGKNDIILSMIQELENQKLYVQDEFKKAQILNKEKQCLYTELQLAKQQIKELNQTIEKLKQQNLESSEPCEILHQDYLKSHEAVLNFIKQQY